MYLVNPAHAELSAQTTAGNLLIVSNSLLYAVYIVISKDLFRALRRAERHHLDFSGRIAGYSAGRNLRNAK